MSDEHRFDDDGGGNHGQVSPSTLRLNTTIMFTVNSPCLTNEQASHVEMIGRSFALHMASKYVKGQQEHGGNLWDMTQEQLIEEAIYEAIDQIVYLMTLREKIRGIR